MFYQIGSKNSIPLPYKSIDPLGREEWSLLRNTIVCVMKYDSSLTIIAIDTSNISVPGNDLFCIPSISVSVFDVDFVT